MWMNNDFIKRKDNLPWQVMGGSTLVLNPSNSSAHEFNGSAGFIWDKLDQGIIFSELVSEICKKYEVVKNEVENDLQDFLAKLKENELLL